jgi:VanZ family protein
LPFCVFRRGPGFVVIIRSEMADSFNAAAPMPLLIRIIKYWLPVAMMLAVMYYFSTDTFSSDNTRGVVENIFLWFFPHAREHTMEVLNYLTRKSAHFTEYAILGALLFWAFRADSPLRWRFRWAVYSFASAVSWALLDELHQTFTRGRTGSIWDSLLDSSGGLFAVSLIALYSARPTRRSS